MAVKNVSVDLRGHPLSREENGVIFEVKNGRSKFGELIVSKGGVRWKPKNNWDHHHLSWKELDRIARDFPRR